MSIIILLLFSLVQCSGRAVQWWRRILLFFHGAVHVAAAAHGIRISPRCQFCSHCCCPSQCGILPSNSKRFNLLQPQQNGLGLLETNETGLRAVSALSNYKDLVCLDNFKTEKRFVCLPGQLYTTRKKKEEGNSFDLN